MATANGNVNTYSLKDVLAAKDPDGKLAVVAEVLQQSNPILEDVPWVEGLLEVGDRVTVRQSLGSPQWKRFNEHIKASTAKTTQVDELTGHVEDWSEIDADLADKAGSLNSFLMRESKAKMEAMGQEVATRLLYGNISTDPKTFHGFMPRMDALNETYGNGKPIVINAGGSTASANGSILIVGWNDNTIHGIYPKYSKGGLQFENKGKVTSENSDGYLDVYRSKFSWECGLAVRDYRYAVRIANIDIASLSTIGGSSDTSAQLYLQFIDALSAIPQPTRVNLRAYAPRQVWAALSKKAAMSGDRATNKSITEVGLVTDIMGVPLRMLDCMLTTEAVVK